MNKNTIRLVVGSKNPVKVSAAYQAFHQMFPDHVIECEGVDAPSGVADQPMTEQETRLGAENRARYCLSHYQSSNGATEKDIVEFYVAMEGGVDKFEEGAATFAYVSILDNNGKLTTNRSASLPLPMPFYHRLRQGEELGDVMDDEFNTINVKQKGGAIGLFTRGVESRESIYTQALVLCLAPFIYPNYFFED